MPQIRRGEQAKHDIVEAADYLALDNFDAAMRFLDAVEEAFTFLSENPQAGVKRLTAASTLAEIRMWKVPKFERYLIFYRIVDASIEIVRVLHGARHVDKILDE